MTGGRRSADGDASSADRIVDGVSQGGVDRVAMIGSDSAKRAEG
jgi:hypothetical protein